MLSGRDNGRQGGRWVSWGSVMSVVMSGRDDGRRGGRWVSWGRVGGRSNARLAWNARVGDVAVGVAVDDGVVATIIGVASVGGVRWTPGVCVHRADLALRHSILQQNVGVDESAGGTAVEVLLVVGRGLLAINDATLRVELGGAGDVRVSAFLDVGVAVVGDRGVDGSIAQALAGVARDIEVCGRSDCGSASENESGIHFAEGC